ncbi:MAG: enoyl-CoA hydratase-related protein [Christensenella sp.]|uniref:enoyl-CoA hydratase/isomerase family protein n=1 Tax=Christensenella sp. TaxID=1935934 RepID=UPI002B210F9F|nr:enoyl-CoA hydratase-related protein [Christensenella sp.]MEA5002518.1 enoyl-CoA hydratase-related protein [Christensenella sp.]
MDFKGLLYEKRGRIGIISFHRPEVLNAMNTDTVIEMKKVFDLMEEDPDIRCVILTGEGSRAFCAGGDIHEEAEKDVLAAYEFVRNGGELLEKMERFKAPIIAAINGYCLGGGVEFAIACDLRIAADNALMGSPEITLGVYPGWGGTQRLPRLIGMSKARLMMYTGDKYHAQEALAMGLVDQVVPAESLMESAMALAEKIASRAPLAIRYIKTSVYDGMQCDLQRALQMEAALFAHLYATQDTKEAYAAYLEKREPKDFIGR